MLTSEIEQLREHYDRIALTDDDRITALDYNLRDLEIDLASQFIRDGDTILDIGCGLGYALRQYAKRRQLTRAVGIDFSQNMVAGAKRKIASEQLEATVECQYGSVLEMPFCNHHFDVVTSHRCLLALLDWEAQKTALREIHRTLKPGGLAAIMEGTVEGLERLNFFRRMFGLPEIDEGGRDGYGRLLFREDQFLSFVQSLFETVHIQRFGMYYFLTRIVQPLFVAPEAPRYDHKLNDVARGIARMIPDFESMGHLVGFILRKRP